MLHINKQLQELANINADACNFYKKAQERTQSSQTKRIFSNLIALHEGVKVNVEEIIRDYGDEPKTSETIEGGARELWGGLVASISNDVDQTLITHLEETEDRCLHSVKDILQSENIPETTKTLLESEYLALRKSHDYMKALKDVVNAA